MKYFPILIIAVVLLLSLGACNNNTTADKTTQQMADEAVASDHKTDGTGTFSAGGKSFSGRVSVQDFPATGQYSVLCQDESDPNASKLIQFMFKDEGSARAAGPRELAYDQGKDQMPGEVALTYDNTYVSHEKVPGTVAVTKSGSTSEIVFEGVEVETMSKEKTTVSGRISF